MTPRGSAIRYNEAVASFIEFARTLSDEEWATRVPCTPAWTARDVLSHVSGIPDDALAGRMDGPATEPWTASQVERNRDFSVDELLQRWTEQFDFFGQAIEAMGEERPPYDCHSHEHDVRHAIGRPGNRENSIIDDAFDRFGEMFAQGGAPVALDIAVDGGEVQQTGDRTSSRNVGLTSTKFEIVRSRLGRRSREQVRGYDWTGSDDDINAVIDHWFSFGPSELAIDE